MSFYVYKLNHLTCIMPYLLFSDSISNTHSNAMYTRRTLFCVILKGATYTYPQEVPEDVFLRITIFGHLGARFAFSPHL